MIDRRSPIDGNVSLSYHFPSAFVDGGWADDVVITVGGGLIKNVRVHVDAPQACREPHVECVNGVAIPGMVNVHSHAFQRKLAGLSEYRTGEHDSFWTWRTLMYESAKRWNPEDVYVIALGLYRELLANGYTWVGEFHYLHNDKDGSSYPDATCMSDALVAAAQACGIGICILPVLYQRAGFQGGELDPAQRRFAMAEDVFIDRLTSLREHWTDAANVRIGVAFHSLRAVASDVVNRVVEAVRRDCLETPFHIHVAEQMQEVADCQVTTGKRPVEYLCSEADVDDRWCLIHATHITSSEMESIVKCGATVGVCPTTEANLGDGLFPAAEYLHRGGKIAIGSDSHVSVNPRSELRLLEYGQRLHSHQRAILGTDTASVGRHLYVSAAIGGAKSLGIQTGRLSVGQRADVVVIDPTHRTLDSVSGDRVFDRYVFCDAGNPVARVMVGGQWVVS